MAPGVTNSPMTRILMVSRKSLRNHVINVFTTL
jgi:hypothetical protein